MKTRFVMVPITRKEFLGLPMPLRRRILRRQTEQLKKDMIHQKFLDSLDVEEDP